jgi:predicted dehydrogenase
MLELYTAEKGMFQDMVVPPFGPHLTGFVLDAVAHFVESVVNGKPLLADGEDGLKNTRIISAMLEAADTGRRVEL